MAESSTRSDELKALSDAATPGPWGAFDSVNPHIISTPLVKGVYLYPEAESLDTPDGRFVVALVNAYRAGELVVRSERGPSKSKMQEHWNALQHGEISAEDFACIVATDYQLDMPAKRNSSG
jgi:hypothetical protein